MRATRVSFVGCEKMVASVLRSEAGVWIDLRLSDQTSWESPLTLHFRGGEDAFEKAMRIAAAINGETANEAALPIAAE